MGPGRSRPSNPELATFNQWKNVVRNNRGDFYTGAQPSCGNERLIARELGNQGLSACRPRIAIRFSLVADGPARLVIYDVNGRRIRTLIDRRLGLGQARGGRTRAGSAAVIPARTVTQYMSS